MDNSSVDPTPPPPEIIESPTSKLSFKTLRELELNSLREKALTSNQRDKYARSSSFRSPEEAEAYLSSLFSQQRKERHSSGTNLTASTTSSTVPPSHLTSSVDISNWYLLQRQRELEERKRREEAEAYLRAYRGSVWFDSQQQQPSHPLLISSNSLRNVVDNFVTSDPENVVPISENICAKEVHHRPSFEKISTPMESQPTTTNKDETVELKQTPDCTQFHQDINIIDSTHDESSPAIELHTSEASATSMEPTTAETEVKTDDCTSMNDTIVSCTLSHGNDDQILTDSISDPLLPTDNHTSHVSDKDMKRYRIYVRHGCPHSHQITVSLALKGLTGTIQTEYIDNATTRTSIMDEPLNEPDVNYNGSTESSSNETSFEAPPVPSLWDTELKSLLSDDISVILQKVNTDFNTWADNPSLDLYPLECREDIDEILERFIHSKLYDGVKKCGLATTQEEYDHEIDCWTEAYDRVESMLQKKRYIASDSKITLADVSLFVILLSLDEIYSFLFRVNTRSIRSTPTILNYLRGIYQMKDVEATCDFDKIKKYYYTTFSSINRDGIIPRGRGDFAILLKEAHDSIN